MYFRKDGAPAHNAQITTSYLTDHQEKWFDICILSHWLSGSTDLNPLNFLLHSFVKAKFIRFLSLLWKIKNVKLKVIIRM
ncbi:hypothetical protein WH47_00646 [Habropoda laboriosa]|uniref:Histone-lysine N-methyltransferase SETMAR n=1 Tax=Habropoda laboriosa TaxID=597456 RepID=A0A0L7RIE8_9HYME|nr:hypothetical protein WH47_00646 [Habropoda laboriosa]